MINPDSPVVFISYDEPNADENYAELLKIVPRALRVHGVKGFDAAHKAAVKVALEVDINARHIFTVDGDNQLIASEWKALQLRLRNIDDYNPEYLANKVFSWRAINNVNGLCYGNGGLKLWPISWIENMKTHEVSTNNGVDFCWDKNYKQLSAIMSITYINGDPYQAWRTGFREGVKMTLNGGQVQDKFDIAAQARHTNFRRFLVWASIGRDVQHGEWAILGALMGFSMAQSRVDLVAMIIDYEEFFPGAWSRCLKNFGILDPVHISPSQSTEMKDYMLSLRTEIKSYNLDIPAFGELQSKTCKLLMEYKQPDDLFEEEKWDQKNLSLEL